jgi:thiamine-phosphate pyrophosphorylase
VTQGWGLYLVLTDPVAGYVACTEAAVRAGLRHVQLRMKGTASAEMVRVGRELRAITRGTQTSLIINDEVEVARAVDADGLHLGQTDLSIPEARRLWPEGKLFGLSTHNEAQAAAAVSAGPDYIGVGPVYATPSKLIADPVLGLARAVEIARRSPLPTVTIGGIDRQRLPALVACGIRSYAVVRYVCQRRDPLNAIIELQSTEAEAAALLHGKTALHEPCP